MAYEIPIATPPSYINNNHPISTTISVINMENNPLFFSNATEINITESYIIEDIIPPHIIHKMNLEITLIRKSLFIHGGLSLMYFIFYPTVYSLFSIIVSIYGNIVIRLKNSVKIRKLVLNLLIILIILDTLCRTWYCIVYITEKNILYKFYNTIGLLGIYIWALLCNLFILFVLSNSKVIYYDERINLTDLINLDSPA
jgi:hypothetical protein